MGRTVYLRIGRYDNHCDMMLEEGSDATSKQLNVSGGPNYGKLIQLHGQSGECETADAIAAIRATKRAVLARGRHMGPNTTPVAIGYQLTTKRLWRERLADWSMFARDVVAKE